MFIKTQRALHVKWDEFLRPFTRRLWMLQLLSMILIGLCFGVTYHVGQNLGLEAGVASIFQNLYDALFYTFASFCQQGKVSHTATHNLQHQIILLPCLHKHNVTCHFSSMKLNKYTYQLHYICVCLQVRALELMGKFFTNLTKMFKCDKSLTKKQTLHVQNCAVCMSDVTP